MNCQRIFLVALLFVLLLLAGCKVEDISYIDEVFKNEPIESFQDEPEYGGHIILPLTKVSSLNPLTVNNESYFHFSKLIFESLFEFDKDFKIKSELAESYTFKDDNIVSIKLKDNVYWHDGEKLSTQDIDFTINVIKYGGDRTVYNKMWKEFVGSYNYANLNNIIDVKVIDDLNIEIVFDEEVGNKLEILTFPIIAKHRFVDDIENIEAYEKALDEENYIPIGTGPYKFVNYERNRSIELTYNENYRNGRPYIEKITGKILTDNELGLTAFESGQVDLALSVGFDWEKFDENDNVKIVEFISQSYEFLGFNFGSEIINKYGNGLRKAIAYGIDRQSIIENVFLGHATQSDLPIHPDSWVLSNDSNVYGFNLSKGRNELEKMGWKDIDSDGYYEDENGNEITLRIVTNSYNPIRLKTANLIVENMKQLGIHIVKDYPDNIPDNLAEEDISKQWEMVKEKLKKGDFDIALLGWNLSPVTELSFAFHSSEIKTNNNFIRYSSEIMDNALAELAKAKEDEKLSFHQKVQSIILNDLPYVGLFFTNRALLVNSKIKGDIDPTFYDIYRNIEKWYVPKDLQ